MENYTDYEFYQSQYMGSLSNDLFDSLIVKASREIDRNINCELTEENIYKLTDREKYQLEYATCEMVDFLQNNGTSSSGNANTISIDGVSISGTNESDLKLKKANIYNDLPIKLTRYL